jgi:hypothetical protein
MKYVFSTDEEIKQIIIECLTNFNPAPTQVPAPPPETKLIYSIKGLAEFLNCSSTTAQKIKNSGKVRFMQYGRKCVFDPAQILEDLSKERRGKK